MFRKPRHLRRQEPDWTRVLSDAAAEAVRQTKRAATVLLVSFVVIAGSLLVLATIAFFGLMEYRLR